jgi:hypothetical protein
MCCSILYACMVQHKCEECTQLTDHKNKGATVYRSELCSYHGSSVVANSVYVIAWITACWPPTTYVTILKSELWYVCVWMDVCGCMLGQPHSCVHGEGASWLFGSITWSINITNIMPAIGHNPDTACFPKVHLNIILSFHSWWF